MKFELPKGNKSRSYKIVSKDGKEVLNGGLKDLKTLFSISKENTIVKDLMKKVNSWAGQNGCEFTIDGKTYAEVYPEKK